MYKILSRRVTAGTDKTEVSETCCFGVKFVSHVIKADINGGT